MKDLLRLPTNFSRFETQNIEKHVLKRFTGVKAFEAATKNKLQELPGEPVPALLTKSMLQEFNPPALHAQRNKV